MVAKAIALELGRIFSNSIPSDLNKDIPPMFNKGNTVMAITIIPMPPSHCKIDRQIKIPLEAFSILSKIVDPVVVIPDIDSKNESVKDKFNDEYMNGIEANNVIATHEKVVIINDCLILSILSTVWFEITIKEPIKMEKIDENKKV